MSPDLFSMFVTPAINSVSIHLEVTNRCERSERLRNFELKTEFHLLVCCHNSLYICLSSDSTSGTSLICTEATIHATQPVDMKNSTVELFSARTERLFVIPKIVLYFQHYMYIKYHVTAY